MALYQLTIAATLEEVSAMTAQLEQWLAHIPDDARGAIALAVQELAVNIAKHAYQGASGTIAYRVDVKPKECHIVLSDHAPTVYQAPNTSHLPDPEALPESGWGMYLIQTLMDGVEYERLADGNRWTLLKRWKA